MNGEALLERGDASGIYSMEEGIELAAPETEEADGDGYASQPSLTPADFQVKVGGTRGDYDQVEESARIGNIVWTVRYEAGGSKDAEGTD